MNTSNTEYEVKTGLSNMGNTCFMNSALQILAHCDELTHIMLSHNFKNKLSETYKQYLMQYNSASSSIVPSKLKNIMGNKFRLFNGYSQQDSHEFMINFLDYLEEDLKKEDLPNNLKHIVSELFDCKMKTVIKSTESKEKSSTENPIRFLCVSIPNKTRITLEDCLMQFIEKEEMGINGSALWETPSKKKEKAIKMNIITTFPKYLIFQVKRYSFKQGQGKKLSTDIMAKEKWKSVLFPEDTFYELKGFIFQSGGLGGGHYVSYIKIKGEWFCFNDCSVNKIDHNIAMKVATKSYLLFYAYRLNTDNVYMNGEIDSDSNNSELDESYDTIVDYNAMDNCSLSRKEKRHLERLKKKESKKRTKRKIYVLTGGKH